MDHFSARLLVFRVADVAAAVDATTVREILPSHATTRIPGAPPAVLGLINVRGELVTLLHGPSLVGAPTSGGAGETLLLMQWAGQGVAVTVDAVVDLIPTGEAGLTPRDELPGIDPQLVRAAGTYAGGSFIVLDLDAVLRPLLAA